jgi:type II secretory pathway pseudopilin PulG
MMPRLDDERGWTLVVAMVVLVLMLMFGLATLSVVDTQSQQSRKQRVRESAFNYAEAALGNQVYLLTHNWPDSSLNGYPACTPASTATTQCPVDATLRANFAQAGATQVDYVSGATWKTQVLDDGTCGAVDYSKYYRETLASCVGAANWDANANDQVWVRAEGTARGHTRALVGRAQIQKQVLPFPRFAVQAGHMIMANNKNQRVDAGGSSIQLRCTDPQPPHQGSSCADFDPAQITNGSTQYGYGPVHALSSSWRANSKTAAINQGHFCADPTVSGGTPSSAGFCNGAGCPANLGNPAQTKPGWTVWVERPTGTCSYTANTNWNSATDPGIVIFNDGALSVGGTSTFYGIIYMVNMSNSTATLFSQSGNATMVGAVGVDGPGGIDLGNSANTRITYDPNVLGRVTSNATAGIVQNSWRQVK